MQKIDCVSKEKLVSYGKVINEEELQFQQIHHSDRVL
jgi:hypothetical protein